MFMMLNRKDTVRGHRPCVSLMITAKEEAKANPVAPKTKDPSTSVRKDILVLYG